MYRTVVLVVIGCFMLAVLCGSSGICSARPAPRQSEEGPPEKRGATETSQQNSGSTDESSASASQPDPRDHENTLGKHVFKDFAEDQKAIWTSPRHVRLVDAE